MPTRNSKLKTYLTPNWGVLCDSFVMLHLLADGEFRR